MERSMKGKRGWTAVILLLVTLASVACQPTASTTPSAAKGAPASGQAAARQPEGTLRVGVSIWGQGIVDTPVTAGRDRGQLVLLYDWLVGTKLDGSDISPDTGIATKWEIAPDGSSWTFNIRKGIQFHDGYGEVTADDVKFSMERTMFSPKSRADFVPALKASIDNIQVVDPYTVKFNMKQRVFALPYDLSAIAGAEGIIVSKKHIEKVGEDAFSKHPVGTGPYKFAELATGSYIKYAATDRHFAVGVPKFKEVYIQYVAEEATRIAMLKTGELDLIDVSGDRVDQLEKDYTIGQRAGYGQLIVYYVALWQGALADKRVRQAIDLAIDRETLLRTIFKGKGAVLSGFTYPSWAVGTKPGQRHPYDPDKARALLQEAGKSNLELDFPTSPDLSLVTQAVAGMLEKAGFKPKVQTMDDAASNEKYRRYATVAANPPPAAITLIKGTNRLFPASLWATLFRSDGVYSKTQDPKLDALIDDVARAKNLEEHASRVPLVEEYIDAEKIALVLLDIDDIYAANPKKVQKWAAGAKVGYDPGLREIVSSVN